jgi:hypothetical protein
MKERSINMSLDFTRLGVRLAHTAITLGLEKLREPKKLTVGDIMPHTGQDTGQDTGQVEKQAKKQVEKQVVEAPVSVTSGVSTADTIAYQNRELIKEMLLLEAHLQQGCKIGGVACDCCLVPGSIIYSNPSPVMIEDGPSTVISHTGKVRKTTELFEREFSGDICSLRVGYSNIPLEVTPEHQVLAAINVRVRQHSMWRKKGIDENVITWVNASDITDRDFIAFPRITGANDVPYSKYFMELLGWYVAEGSIGKVDRRITLSLSANEPRRRIEGLIRLLGAEIHERDIGNVHHISFTNRKFFSAAEQFGRGARNKYLPQWFLTIPFNKQYSFLSGIIHGDGSVNDKYGIGITTTSIKMAAQLRLVLFRLGLLHGLHRRKINTSYIDGREIKPGGHRYDILVSGDSAKELASATYMRYDGGKKTAGNHGWVSEHYVFLPIMSNEKRPYSGIVHNLAVESDESYLTINGAVHNCSKHPITIEALAHETSGMTGRPVYTKVAEWARKVGPITTPEASASGQYDNEYPKVAMELRGIRKELMTEMIASKE